MASVTTSDDCPVCGSTTRAEVTTFGEANARYICGDGHRWQEVEFRRARQYVPPLLYIDPRDMEPPVAAFDPDPSPIGLALPPIRSIHCGPAADLPQPPTPDELLQAAGLGYLAA